MEKLYKHFSKFHVFNKIYKKQNEKYNSSKQLRKLISNGIIKCAKEIEKNPEER